MNDFRGFVYLHRKLLDNPIFKNQNTLQLFIYFLLKATHKEYTATVGDQFIDLKAGELVTGRKAIMRDTGMGEQTVRTTINNLKKLKFLTIKSTNKYSVVTILEWNCYQQTNQQETNSQPQTITYNNNNNKEKKTSRFKKPELHELANYFLEKGLEVPQASKESQAFYDYYESNGWKVGKNKMVAWKNAASGWIKRSKQYENTKRNESTELDFNSTGWSTPNG